MHQSKKKNQRAKVTTEVEEEATEVVKTDQRLKVENLTIKDARKMEPRLRVDNIKAEKESLAISNVRRKTKILSYTNIIMARDPRSIK